MPFLSRSALIVRRKTPDLDWANGLTDTDGVELTVEIAQTPTLISIGLDVSGSEGQE